MGEERKGTIMLVTVDHYDTVDSVAASFANRDMEYIRKRVNAFRNRYNPQLSYNAGRTYESMKTLIDVNEILLDSGPEIYTLIPKRTCATVSESEYAEIETTGSVDYTNYLYDPRLDPQVPVRYKIRTTFNIYPDGSEMYGVEYTVFWGKDDDQESITWTDVYRVDDKEGLGYAETFPAPSVLAGGLVEGLTGMLHRVMHDSPATDAGSDGADGETIEEAETDGGSID